MYPSPPVHMWNRYLLPVPVPEPKTVNLAMPATVHLAMRTRISSLKMISEGGMP